MKFVKALKENMNTVKALVSHNVYKAGPKAMIIAGTGLAVAAVVLAVKESVEKNDDGDTVVEEVSEFKKDIDSAKEYCTNKKDLLFEKARLSVLFAKKMFKRYVWSIVALSLGIAMTFGSHHLMAKRLANAGAMVTALTERINEEEKRVNDNCAPEVASAILNDVVNNQTTKVDYDTGEVTVEGDKIVRPVGNGSMAIPYFIEISEVTCPRINFIQTNRRQALSEIKFVEPVLQHQLEKNHGISCWDLLDALGYRKDLLSDKEKEQAKVIGIAYNKGTDPEKIIDLGLDSICKAEANAWADGEIDCFYLRPNWDGYVADKY